MRVHKHKTIILSVATILFLLAMSFLSLSARHIHNATLPKVTTSRPQSMLFPTEDGELTQSFVIEKSRYDKGETYIIYTRQKNGEERSFVRSINITIGREKDGYYEVISGVDSRDRLVTEWDGSIYDGCEVIAR